MALRNLTTQSMVAVGARWLDPGQERPILQRYALTRALLHHLETTHARLIEFQRRSTDTEEAVQHLTERLAALDAQHDRLLRGVFGMLTSLAELADGEERATHFLDLRDTLFPDGLRGVSRSYWDQSGEAVLLRGRLNERIVQSLRSILTPNGSLFGHVQTLLDVARVMGELEAQRISLAKTSTDTTRADVARARNEWIRVVTALRAATSLDGVSPEESDRIFRHLDEAEAKADRRAQPAPTSKAATNGASTPPPAPSCAEDQSEPAPDSAA